MSELQAPLFHRYVRGQPQWLTRPGATVDTLTGNSVAWPEDPVTVISLSRAVCEDIAGLMRHLERKRAMNTEQMARHEERVWAEADKYLPWAGLPGTRVWIEEADGGGRAAFYVAPLPKHMRAPMERRTHVAFVVRPNGLHSVADMTVGVDTAGAEFINRKGLAGDPSERISLAVFQLQLAITCAMIAAPGVRVSDERKREKRYQFQRGVVAPEVIYKCVDVDLDALADNPVVEMGQGVARGAGVARHLVRGHPRMTPKGWVMVRAHWRGDLRYGLRLRDSNIKRHEEMAGA